MRIISLVPSLSDSICTLGGKDKLIGCTQFCVRPPDLHRTATVLGGTKDPNISLISDLVPDLIVVNTEENRRVDIEACRKIAKVYECFPKSPADVPAMLEGLGDAIQSSSQSKDIAKQITEVLKELRTKSPGNGKRFAYFIWKNPYMLAGPDTYISKLLEAAGFQNAVQSDQRYPSLSLDEISKFSPDILFLSSEPYPFRKRDLPEITAAFPPTTAVYKIDGQLMSWFGTLTLTAIQKLLTWPQTDAHFAQNWSA